MKMSIVIPCYNEKENIPIILDKFDSILTNEDIEIILVNNGSTDNSDEVLKRLLPKYLFARTVLVPINKGYGYGILQGLKEAKGDFLGWMHADMQTTPSDVLKSYKILEENSWNKNIFVKGRRRKRPLFKRIVTLGMSLFESILFGEILHDIGAQPNFFSKEFFNSWINPPVDFAFDTYAFYMAKKNKMKIIRYDIMFLERVNGRAFFGTGLPAVFKATKRMVISTYNLKKQLKRRGRKL